MKCYRCKKENPSRVVHPIGHMNICAECFWDGDNVRCVVDPSTDWIDDLVDALELEGSKYMYA